MIQEVNLIEEALKFMFVGMGIVFLFLITLSFILTIQHKIISHFFKDDEVSIPSNNNNKNRLSINKKIAAISTAIMQYNKK